MLKIISNGCSHAGLLDQKREKAQFLNQCVQQQRASNLSEDDRRQLEAQIVQTKVEAETLKEQIAAQRTGRSPGFWPW